MKISWTSLLTLLLTAIILNIWKLSEMGSIEYYLSTISGFGLIGWWWRK